MNGQQKYTAEDIRLYLEGKLSPSQMHALEKEALSDPFLADALEGMRQYGQHDNFVSDTEELRWRLKEKVNATRTTAHPAGKLWWKIAAVLMIVITGVALIIFTGEKNNNQQVELAKTERRKDIIRPEPPVANDSLKQEAAASKPAPELSMRKSAKQPARRAEEVQQEKKPNTDPPVAKKTEVQQQTADNELNEMKAEESSPAVTSRSANEAPAMASTGFESDSSISNYRVIDLGNVNGRANAGNARARTEREHASLEVVPENGWHSFERYLKDSLKVSTSGQAEVTVSFAINEQGLPDSIRVVRPTSPAHAREIDRLLRQGPSWQVAPGKKRHVTLKIIF